jgi:N-acetylglucosamine malate deacetylase 2
MKKWLIVSSGIIGFILLASPWVLILFAKGELHDAGIPKRNNLVEKEPKFRVLALFPHPDDEVTVAGTLMKLKEDGHEIYLVCLTRGEKGKSSGIEDENELAGLRTKEMEKSASLLGVERLIIGNYPDSGLVAMGLDSLKSIASKIIKDIQPDILVSNDSKVGLYGHSDHQITGLALEEVFKENLGLPDFKPEKLFQVTLCKKQIKIALQLSSGFQKHYPEDPSQGLPDPQFSVNTRPFFNQVLKIMSAHETQRVVLRDLMPFHEEIPSWIYSRIFDREYFHEVK